MKVLRIRMPDRSYWDVPVEVIARHRAANYADEFNGDVERSLAEDTWPLFEESPYDIEDWAANNMNWEDVAAHARQSVPPPPMDPSEGWWNRAGDGWEVIEEATP